MIPAEGCRVAIRYAIVDQVSLAARPLAERLLPSSSHQDGGVTWQRAEAPHQVEIASTWPVIDLEVLVPHFARSVARIDEALALEGARLMPGGLHPFMDPKLPDGQAVRLELPAGSAPERTLGAIEILLPLLPALTGASPFSDGARRGASARSARFGPAQPRVTGQTLSFVAGDTQEHPGRDVAVCSAVARLVRVVARSGIEPPPLSERRSVHAATCADAERALIPAAYVARLDLGNEPLRAGCLWRRLLERAEVLDRPLQHLLARGSLATRLSRGLDARPTHSTLVERYRCLAECLAGGADYDA